MTSDADAAAAREARRRARAARRGSRVAPAPPADEAPSAPERTGEPAAVPPSDAPEPTPAAAPHATATAPDATAPDATAPDATAGPAADAAQAPARRRLPLPRRRPGGSRTPPPWSVVVIACVLAVLGLVVAAVALRQAGGGEVREDALEAARDHTVSLTTYDYRRLDEDFERVLGVATGDFAREYRETTDELRPAFTEQQATAVGRVVGAGIEQLDGDRAVAVVVVDQVLRTTGQPQRTERNQLRMALVREDGRWLVTRVERL